MEHGTNSPFSDGLSLYPQSAALRIFPDARINVDLQAAAEAAPAQILQQPKHGKVYLKDGFDFKYMPNKSYVGHDKIVFLVNIDGHKIKVVYFVRVASIDIRTMENFKNAGKNYCPKSDWRISKSDFIPGLTRRSTSLLLVAGRCAINPRSAG